MTQTEKQYTNYALQSLIVSALEKDGAFVSFFAKNYNEQATYEGGSGLRKTFNFYNNLIIKFHTLLKVLTGEQRANIYESIPALDFLNPENTSFLYSYDTQDGQVDTTTIRSASNVEKTALELILNEDPFIINRAIVGEKIAEHFYNTVGNANTPNIQTSPWLGNTYVEYLYRGIKENTLKVKGKELEASILKTSMYAFEASLPEDDLTDLYDAGTSYIRFTPNISTLDDDLLANLNELGVEALYKESQFNIVSGTDYSKNYGYVDPYSIDGNTFLTWDSDNNEKYQIELNAEDIAVVLPKSVLGGLSNLIVFKKDSSATSSVAESLTWGSYKPLNEDSNGNESLGSIVTGISDLTEVSAGTVYHLIDYPENAYPVDSTVKDGIVTKGSTPLTQIPGELQTDVDIVCIEDVTTSGTGHASKWKISGKNYVPFYIPISSYTSSGSFEEVKANDAIPDYLERTGVYEIISNLASVEKVYTSGASGLLCGFYEEPYRRDNVLIEDQTKDPESTSTVTSWKFINEVDTAAKKGVSIEVGSKYFKGHLLGRGYFSDEPLKLTESDYSDRKGICKVEGSGENKKLKRLADNTYYNGKILLTYDILSGAASTLFDRVKVPNFNNFTLRSIDDVVTRADYDGRTYSLAEAKNLLSEDEVNKISKNNSSSYTYASILNYPSKLAALNKDTAGNKIADEEQILQYFESVLSCVTRNDIPGESYTLYLDLTDDDGPCVSRKTSYQKMATRVEVPNYVSDGKNGVKVDGTRIQEGTTVNISTSTTGGSLGDIYTQLDKNFAVSYEVNLQEITQKDLDNSQAGAYSLADLTNQVGSAFNITVKLITPMEVFSTKNHYINSRFVDSHTSGNVYYTNTKLSSSNRLIPTGTILVYPEYSKYLPTTMFLLSKKDLGLEVDDGKENSSTRSMVSFLAKGTNSNPNSVISFKVASVKSFKPSKITKVKLKTSSNHYEEINYDYGLYPSYQIETHKRVTGFEQVSTTIASGVVSNSQGETFNLQNILNGNYVLYGKGGSDIITYENVGTTSLATAAVAYDIDVDNNNVNSVAVNRLTGLMTDLASASVSTPDDEDVETSYTKKETTLTSRETSETKNASSVSTIENKIAESRNSKNPGYGDLSSTATISQGYSYKKESLLESAGTNLEDGTISMGGESSPPEVTRSGLNTYYTNRTVLNRLDAWGADGIRNETIVVNVPVYENTYVYKASVSDVYDCYIYTLEPMSLELDTIKIYDQRNKEVPFSNLSNIQIIPMAYPSNFFAVNTGKDSEGKEVYTLKNRRNVTSLKDRLIIPGLPEFTNKETLLTAYTRGISMEPIANMIFAEDSASAKAINSILGNAIYSVLKSWKLSGIDDDSPLINPLLLEDFPTLVSGLIDAKPILKELGDSNFNIPLGTDVYTITPKDVNSIISRIVNDGVSYKRTYEAAVGNTYTKSDKWLEKLTDDIATGAEGTDYTAYDKAFVEELKKRLSNIGVTTTWIKTTRPSLKRMADHVAKAFVTTDALDVSLCKTLDSYFGNGTKAFLKLGNSEETSMTTTSSGNQVSLSMNESVSLLGNDINSKISDIVLEMAIDAEKKAYKVKHNNESLEDTINKKLKVFFTDTSVGTIGVIPSDQLESTIKSSRFVLKTYTPSNSEMKALLQIVKNTYLTKHPSCYEAQSWRRLSFNNWVANYKLTENSVSVSDFREKATGWRRFFSLYSALSKYYIYRQILEDLRSLVNSKLLTEIRALYNESALPVKGDALSYFIRTESGETHMNSVYGILGEHTENVPVGLTAGDFCLTEVLPVYRPGDNSFKASTTFSSLLVTTGYKPKQPNTSKKKVTNSEGKEVEETYIPDVNTDTGFENIARQDFTLYTEDPCDAKTIVLRGIADYVKTSLEGTGSDRYYVKYVKGDSKPSGRTNSLYYKRYLALNNRMNTTEGSFKTLIPIFRNKASLFASADYNRNLAETYSDSITVVPVAKFSELTWMPKQEAVGTSIAIPGKFYYKAELEALKEQIGSQCVLTCTQCSVKDSCPFYNEDEIIKLYCTPAETIDLYFKDNELDLIAYTDEVRDAEGNVTEVAYPDVKAVSDDGLTTESIDTNKLKRMHSYYNDILKKVSGDKQAEESFEGRDLQQVKEELSNAFNDTSIFNSATDGEDLGYLLGARYGTVRKSNIAVMANKDDSFTEFGSTPIPEYQFLYDAVYLKDEETYFNYGVSPYVYDVSFDMGSKTNKKHFEGKIKIKEPTGLKALANADPSDYVYLMSDDTKDSDGNTIVPIIYLGQAGTLSYSMGIIDDPKRSIQSEYDANTYASDIAQWCINYYKGHCAEDPIEDIGDDFANPSKPVEEDQDQYWMETIKKKVVNSEGTASWITLEGRPRADIGYQEPLMDPNAVDEVKIASGRPAVANYINFIRKISIRIYNGDYADQYDEAGNYLDDRVWTIPWVKGFTSKGVKTLEDGSKITWDSQRQALPYMKTNLRLVIVKNG